MPFFCHIPPAAFPFSDVVPPHSGASMASVQIARQPLWDNMKIFVNRSLVGPQAPVVSMARDVVRIVIAAVLAGTGFALLLALSVLSLTVIAPPAQASGSPTVASSEPDPGRGSAMETPGKQDASADHPAIPPVVASAAAADLPQVPAHEAVFDSLPKTGTARPAVLYLLLALAAGFLAFFVYSLVRRKS
jgi:LPXTG-motif cell wall-anchored protein